MKLPCAATLILSVPRRYWRSRADPFAGVWDAEVVPLLKGAPKLMAVTLLRKLQDDHPERFSDGMLRTLQRHIRHWPALASCRRRSRSHPTPARCLCR